IVPPDKPSVTPTEVKIGVGNWKPSASVTETSVERKFDKNFGVEIGIHNGKATFSQEFQVPSDATGNITPTISVRYQACDATSCLPPKTKTPTVGGIVVEAGTSPVSVIPARQDPVQFTTKINPTTARPGEYVQVAVTATIQDGYHIY